MKKSSPPEFKPPWSNDPNKRDEHPRDASTVILLREGPSSEGPEVFMVRRHGKASFMGGIWVFPGGKVDAADSDPTLLVLAPAGTAERAATRLEEARSEAPSAQAAFALHVAAARELFEEAGVLLARPASEDRPGGSLPIEEWRSRIHEGVVSFATMLAQEGLLLDLDGLSYVSRWLTPSAEAMRFDARFFALRLPEGQTARADRKETTKGEWRTAGRFLEAHAEGELTLAPPNIRNLEDLAAHRSIDDYLDAMKSRPVAPILPKMVMDGSTMKVLLPWDPSYDTFEGESLDLGPAPHPLAEVGGPPRFVLRDGRFFSQ